MGNTVILLDSAGTVVGLAVAEQPWCRYISVLVCVCPWVACWVSLQSRLLVHLCRDGAYLSSLHGL